MTLSLITKEDTFFWLKYNSKNIDNKYDTTRIILDSSGSVGTDSGVAGTSDRLLVNPKMGLSNGDGAPKEWKLAKVIGPHCERCGVDVT